MESVEEKKRLILDLIRKSELGVISTVSSEALPEAAVIGISETEDLTIFFGTFATSRKYANLKLRPRAAFVIGWDKVTVQYEGMATELSGEEKERAIEAHIRKLPGSAKFAQLPEQRYFKVSPLWIRYTDLSDHSVYGGVFELTFQ